MIDTAMVIWTSGLWKRLLRTTGMLMLLFTCVCGLSFLITTSRDKWSGLVSLKTSPDATGINMPTSSQASDATATALPMPVPTARPAAMRYIIPIIPQNPIQPDAAHSHKHAPHTYQPTSTPHPTTRHPTPSSNNSSQDPMLNALQNLP